MTIAAEIVMKHAAVIDHPRHHLHAVFFAGRQRQPHRPGFERIENEHRPIDELAKALEAADEVERKAIGRAGRDAEHVSSGLRPSPPLNAFHTASLV
jgi:hypothetical protein